MDELRKKLIELIGKIQDEGRDYSECFCDRDSPAIVSNDVLADHLIANGVTVADGKDTDVPTEISTQTQSGEPLTNCQQWIPVTERLPEMKHEPYNVLVCHDIKGALIMDCAWYSHCKQKWCSFNGMNLKVTHWMPLPEPPKEGA